MSIMKNLNILIAFFTSTLLFGQTETRQLSEFSDMNVSAGIKVILHSASSNYAEVELENAEQEELITVVKGGDLTIKWESNWSMWKRKRSATVNLYYTNIDGVSASSGSHVVADNTINGEEFDIDVSSGAYVELELECNNLDVDVSSGAYLELAGSGNNIDVDVSSGASFKGKEFKAQNADVSASSGAAASVFASQKLDASASSGASVRYGGDPQKTDISASKYSGGSIRKL